MTIDNNGNSGVDTRPRCRMLRRKAMSRTPPPLSVIVLHPASSSRLPACLASLAEQRHVEPEIILINQDSGAAPSAARDGFATAPIVLHESTADPVTALNRGIAAARGEWLLLLHSDDRLVGDMILSECLAWMRKTEAGVVAGEVADDHGRILKLASRPNPIAREFLPPGATFYRRTLFAENGELDPTLPRMAAYDFHLRLWKSRIRFKPVPLRVTATAQHPVFDRAACREEVRVRHRYFNTSRCWWWDLRAFLRSFTARA